MVIYIVFITLQQKTNLNLIIKNYQHQFDEKFKTQFFNACNFFHHGNSKIVLLLQKGVYPYEYMKIGKNLMILYPPPKKKFHGHLNMEDITRYADYTHKKRVSKDFEIKIVG